MTGNHTAMIVVLQEEIEAQIKADKIKMALEKLKEAKVKKVSPCKSTGNAVKPSGHHHTLWKHLETSVRVGEEHGRGSSGLFSSHTIMQIKDVCFYGG